MIIIRKPICMFQGHCIILFDAGSTAMVYFIVRSVIFVACNKGSHCVTLYQRNILDFTDQSTYVIFTILISIPGLSPPNKQTIRGENCLPNLVTRKQNLLMKVLRCWWIHHGGAVPVSHCGYVIIVCGACFRWTTL